MAKDKKVPYPHIKGAGVIIPDCSRGVYTPFRLTSREKRALVRKLAEKGLSGMDDFIRENKEEGAINDRIEEIRKKMQEEIERIRSRKRGTLDDQIRNLSEGGATGERERSDGLLDDGQFRRFASEEIKGDILASDLIGTLEERDVVEEYVPKAGLLKRIWKALKVFFIVILSKIIRFFKRIKNRFFAGGISDKKEKTKKGSVSLPFPSIARDLSEWERKIDSRLDEDDTLQRAVNRRLSDRYGYSQGRIQLKRFSDPAWYKEQAKSILREEIVDKAKETEERLERERKHLLEKKRISDNEAIRKKERIMALRRKFDSEMKEMEKSMDEMSRKEVKKELVSTLSSMGYLKRTGVSEGLRESEEEWEITEALVEKFSELIYTEISDRRKGMIDRKGKQISDAGVYEKARPRMVSEESRMDILGSMVNARINHPRDRTIHTDDMVVLREVTASELHAVLIMDISGSMDENMRMDAAKRSVLALTQAIKKENPRNRVDIISLSTRAELISLRDVMEIEPKGFTNHQEALALARSILSTSRSDKKILFMITDGLPEAYIDENDRPVAGDLDTAMRMALLESARLLSLDDLSFNIFLLEPEDEEFVNSAKKIAREGGGKIIIADPTKLAYQVIGKYEENSLLLGGV